MSPIPTLSISQLRALASMIDTLRAVNVKAKKLQNYLLLNEYPYAK